MNIKSCLKVNNGLLYRTGSLKLEGSGLYTKLGARRRAVVAGSCVSVPCVYALLRLYLDGCVRCVKWLIPGGR
jgi:hypothetical protein